MTNVIKTALVAMAIAFTAVSCEKEQDIVQQNDLNLKATTGTLIATDTDTVDFGVFKKGNNTKVTRDITVRNISDSKLAIFSGTLDMAGIKSVKMQSPIPVGESRVFQISYAPITSNSGVINGVVYIVANRTDTLAIPAKAEVEKDENLPETAVLSIANNQSSLLRVGKNAQVTTTFEVENVGDAVVTNLVAAANVQYGTASVKIDKEDVAPGEKVTVELTYTSTDRSGFDKINFEIDGDNTKPSSKTFRAIIR